MKTFLYTIISILCFATAVRAQNADSSAINLNEVVVSADAASARQKLQPLTIMATGKQYITEHRSNSLMTSLEKLPGVSAFQVGQGFAKPVIRGLGFNRLVVAENGIKQQGQQWGADHGLEIDQYDIDNVEIVKGPASLQYGSEAIAGVVRITSHRWRSEDGLSGSVMLNGGSNNLLFGTSNDIYYQKNNRYFSLRATYQNFESYRVPAISFDYQKYKFSLYRGILKNTAGREADVSLHTGFRTKRYEMGLSVSNIHSKAGFFAGAYGLPGTVDMSDDGQPRAINMPYHEVNHFKAVVNQTYKLNAQHKFTADLGYQYNLRQEFSKPHTHATNPNINRDSLIATMGDIELEMRLQTASGNAAWEYRAGSNLLQAGVNAEYQHNRVGGYFFLLPEFEQFTGGVFATDRYMISEKLAATVGARYDVGYTHVHPFDGKIQGNDPISELKKNNGNASFMGGVAYNPAPEWDLKLNAGKSFRIPTVNEYAIHGITHVMFRMEVGDSTLTPETSYQIDGHTAFKKEWDDGFIRRVSVAASVFANYFPNFIFLKPSSELLESIEAGQKYNYVQSRVFRTGGELEARIDVGNHFRWDISAEYVRATDMDDDFPIALTPPMSITNEWSVLWQKIAWFRHNRFAVAYRYTARQDRVARNEYVTPEFHLIDLSLTVGVPMGRIREAQVVFQVQNLFNIKYYKHLSFYRRMNMPEIGRNMLLSLLIPINR